MISLNDQIKDAKDNLKRIQEEFKDDSELLAIYEPSVKYLLDILEGKEERNE